MYAKIYYEFWFWQNFWNINMLNKKCWISFITGSGGYIFIKSKWFQSTTSLELLEALLPGPHHGQIRGHDNNSTPFPSLQTTCWNWFPKKYLDIPLIATLENSYDIENISLSNYFGIDKMHNIKIPLLSCNQKMT